MASSNIREGAGIAIGSIAVFILLLLIVDRWAVSSGYVKEYGSA